jgi:LacI family gluconate utilization system Gnt-I transcriptional repressor
LPKRKPEAVAPHSIRMREVAEHAGVSRMTVSRALAHPERVREDLRRRVTESVKVLGYVNNNLARSFSSNRSNVVGLVLPSLENSIFSQTLKGISDYLRPAGYQLMVAQSGDDPDDEERVVAAFVAQRVCGLILHQTDHTPDTLRMLKTAGIPVIETGDIPKRPIDRAVSYSNFDAAKAMTLHLGRLGYRKIAFASLKRNPRAAERKRGYLAGLGELGLKADPRLILEVPRGFAGGTEAIRYLSQSAPHADALFCAGDVLAAGALFECQRCGWVVPERLAIASFDDLDLMQHVNPAITSLRLARHEIGRRSAEMLLDRMENPDAAISVIDLGFEIVQRAST